MAKEISENKLIKKAQNGAKCLFALAIFALFISTILLLGYFSEKKPTFIINASWGLFTAISLFMLSRATKKGNTAGLQVVAIIAILQACYSILILCLFTSPFHEIIVDLIIITIALFIAFILIRDRKYILELKKRQLTEKVFALKQSGKILCIIGSALFIATYLLAFTGHYTISYMNIQEKQEKQKKQAEINKEINRMPETYVSILNNQEITFISALEVFVKKATPETKKVLKNSIAKLKTAILSLRQKPKFNQSQLGDIVELYLKAIDSWEAGVSLISSNNPDYENGHRMLAQGNSFRKESVEKYNSIFTVQPTGQK